MHLMVADEIYVELHHAQRISRSHRAGWYINNLYNNVHTDGEPPSEERNIVVRSLLNNGVSYEGAILTPSTKVWYLGSKYSFVFVLDMSASMAVVSGDSVLLDDTYKMLVSCLEILVKPLTVPGCTYTVQPQLYVTVLACTQDCCHSLNQKGLHVVVEGVNVTNSNLSEVAQFILHEIHSIERSLNVNLSHFNDPNEMSHPTSQNLLESMLKGGILGMQLLPRTSIKGIIAFTDGVTGFNSSSSMHATISELRTNNISCWLLKAGSRDMAEWGFGLVPEYETLQFVSSACNGCIVDIRELLGDTESHAKLQRSILITSSQREAFPHTVDEVVNKFVKFHKVTYARTTIEGPLASVLGCRIREGFLTSSIRHENNLLEISLCLPLQPNVTVYYNISVAWPLLPRNLHSISVCFEAPVSFVHDFNSELLPHSPYRANAVKRLKQFLHNLKQADRLLSQLLTFSANPVYSKIPRANRDGMPVFYLPPNQNIPVPSISVNLSGSDKERSHEENSFLNFWKPVCTLDISFWKKWMHSHKLNLVLSPDVYLPQNVLQPSTTGRYASVTSRFALTKLMEFLRNWSSFILLENHTFIKLIFKEENPITFCVVRVVQKQPTLVLHLGCLEGIPHLLLQEVIDSMYTGINKLVEPPSSSASSGRRRFDSSTPYTVSLLMKPLQKVMIWYPAQPNWLSNGTETQTKGAPDDIPLHMQFLSCVQRLWVLSSQLDKSKIAEALIRFRLSQGFHISSCQNGMMTLVLQLPLKQEDGSVFNALLQYILFVNIDKKIANKLATEIWVEPQCGTVGTVPSMPHLRRFTIQEVSNQLIVEDASMLSTMVAFYQLLYCCQARCKPQNPADRIATILPNLYQASIHLSVSSLLPYVRLIGMPFPAFTLDGNVSTVSIANNHLLEHFRRSLNHHFQYYAFTHFGESLEERLMESTLQQMKDYFEIFPKQWHTWWRCEKDEDLYAVLLPVSDWPTVNGKTQIPVIVLQCKPSFILKPYPTEIRQHKRGKDVLIDNALESSMMNDKKALILDDSEHEADHYLQSLVSTIYHYYINSYINASYYCLVQGTNVSQLDIQKALDLCQVLTLKINYNEYLKNVCCHSKACEKSLMLQQEVTRQDKEGLGELGMCVKWSKNLHNEIGRIITKYCLNHVPLCPGFYFHNPSTGEANSLLPSQELSFSTDSLLPSDHPPLSSQESESSTLGEQIGQDSENTSEASLAIDALLDDLTGITTGLVDSNDPPLFMYFSYSVTIEGQVDPVCVNLSQPFPTCLASLMQGIQAEDKELKVSLHLNFLCPPTLHGRQEAPECSFSNSHLETFDLEQLPPKQRFAMLSMSHQIEWLLKDESLSMCFLHQEPDSELLSSVIAHIPDSAHTENCFTEPIAINFVFGVNRCLEYFLEELKALTAYGYSLKTIGDYFMLSPQKKDDKPTDVSIISPVPSSALERKRSYIHRRAQSCGDSFEKLSVPSSSISRSLRKSQSTASSSVNLNPIQLNEVSLTESMSNFWLILRVLNEGVRQYVQLYFHRRSCYSWTDKQLEWDKRVCSEIIQEVEKTNCRVNQWYLLKDMLETHKCHSLLIPESGAKGWVDQVDSEMVVSRYECDCVSRRHFTPYWRMKLTTALNIVRSVLDPFIVTNREDLFVVSETDVSGKETIFYLRIHESMCEEDQLFSRETDLESHHGTGTLDGRDTVLSNIDTMSAISDLGREESVISIPSPVETSHTTVPSIKVSIYGICPPSDKLLENIMGVLQRKLDDMALELLCAQFGRSTNVKLAPQDVRFIQPKLQAPSVKISLLVPKLLGDYVQALAVYFFQLLSTITIKPHYTKETDTFTGSVDDAIFLYLRPVQQGRGLGLLVVTLHDAFGELPFGPSETVPPSPQSWSAEEAYGLFKDKYPCLDIAFKVTIWEKGNIALNDLKTKIENMFRTAMMTCFLEVFLFPSPLTVVPKPKLPSGNQSLVPNRPAMLSSDEDLETSLDTLVEPVPSPNTPDPSPEEVFTSSVPKTWKEVEMEKRHKIDLLKKQQLMESGTEGHLKPHYSHMIWKFLHALLEASTPGIYYWSGAVPSHSDNLKLLEKALSLLVEHCPDFCTRSFQCSNNEYLAVTKPTSVEDTIISFGFCLKQWMEARNPTQADFHSNEPWLHERTRRPLQYFMPLDSKKFCSTIDIPFQQLSTTKPVFIPRQRMLVLSAKERKIEMFAYNLTDEIWSSLLKSLTAVVNRLKICDNLMKHILLQKMGIFYGIALEDKLPYLSPEMANFYRQIGRFSSLLNVTDKQSDVAHLMELDDVLLNATDIPPLDQSVSDPFARHGSQFKSASIELARVTKRSTNLENAFATWYKQDDTMVPNIKLLYIKGLSRIIHICSTLLLDPSVCTRTVSENFEKDFLKKYQQFVTQSTLRFTPIMVSYQRVSPPFTQHQISFQRALPGGILILEITAKDNIFTANLCSLEKSRVGAHSDHGISSKIFSEECVRMKDAIHVHSFSYDFHLRYFHSLFTKRTNLPKGVNAASLLYSFYNRFQQPPKYIQTRLFHDVVGILGDDFKKPLYQHMLAHSASFGLETLDLCNDSSDDSQLCLLWIIDPEMFQCEFDIEYLSAFIIHGVLVLHSGELHLFIFLESKIEKYPTKSESSLAQDCYSPASETGQSLRRIHNTIVENIKDVISSAKTHLQREDLWKKLLYGTVNQRVDGQVPLNTLTCDEVDLLLALVHTVPITHYDTNLVAIFKQKKNWFKSFMTLLEVKYKGDIRSSICEASNRHYTVVINPQWSDMLILVKLNKVESEDQKVLVVYRKPLADQDNPSHNHIEAEQKHIHSFINFASSFIWANLVSHAGK